MSRRDFLKGVATAAAAWPLAACDHSVRTFGRPNTYAIAFSPDGRTCLSGAGDGSLKLWDLATGTALLDFFADSLAINAVAFSPDGRTALSGDSSCKVKLWDIATGKRLRNFWDPAIVFRTGESNSEPHAQWAHFASVTSVAFSLDGRSALSGSWSSDGEDAVLKLWEVATGKPVRAFTGHSQTVQSVAFSPDGLTALSGSPLRLWDVATGKELRTLTPGGKSVAFSPDGLTALTDGLTVVEVATGKELRSFADSDAVYAVAFLPDGRTALSGGSISIYPDLLHFLFPSTFDREGTVRLWEVATGKQLRSFKGHSGSVHSVAFAPDGRSALSGGSDGIRLWDLSRS
jgi:WD40 repeat protein